MVECSSFQLRMQESLPSARLGAAEPGARPPRRARLLRGLRRRRRRASSGARARGTCTSATATTTPPPRVRATAPCAVVWFRAGRARRPARWDTTTTELVSPSARRPEPLGRGERNAGQRADAAAAAAASIAFGAAPTAVRDGLAAFQVAPHRGQVAAVVDGVRFVDDSKATNVHAALAAIDGVDDAVLIAGGRAKGVDLVAARDARSSPAGRDRDRGGRAGHRRRVRRARPGACGAVRSRRPYGPRSTSPARVGASCSHRPARAGTSSATTPNAGDRFAAAARGLEQEVGAGGRLSGGARRQRGSAPRCVRRRDARKPLHAARVNVLLLLVPAAVLTMLGLVMVLSAGSVSATQGYDGNPFWYFQRQVLYALVGVVAAAGRGAHAAHGLAEARGALARRACCP